MALLMNIELVGMAASGTTRTCRHGSLTSAIGGAFRKTFQLNGSRNWWADGDGCDGLHLDAGVVQTSPGEDR